MVEFNKMARKKVKLEFIDNDTARRVTYKKRVKGIVKKTQELSVLCGVDACAIVYGPYDQAPVVWPSAEGEARRILRKYKRKPDIDQSQRRLNMQSFLKQSIIKAEERLEKVQRRNREIEIENLMLDILDGKPLEQVPYSDLGDLLWVIEDKIRGIEHRVTVLEEGQVPPLPPHPSHHNNNNENTKGDGEEMLRGINDEMGERPTWEIEEANTSSSSGSFGSGSSSRFSNTDWHFQ